MREGAAVSCVILGANGIPLLVLWRTVGIPQCQFVKNRGFFVAVRKQQIKFSLKCKRMLISFY